MIALTVGLEYRNGWGDKHHIQGIVKEHPDWVWSLQGCWYEQSTGKLVHLQKGVHRVVPYTTNYDIKEQSHNA